MEENSEFLQVPGPLRRTKTIYVDSHLASLGGSLFYVPEPIKGIELGISKFQIL